MSLRRSGLPDPADALRSAIPVGLLVLAAALPAATVGVRGVLAGGLRVAAGRQTPVRWSWAAAIPVAVSLAWARTAATTAAPGGADCSAPTSPLAIWGLAEAVLVLAIVAALAAMLRATPRDLALRRPGRAVVRWAFVGPAVVLAAGVVVLLAAGAASGGPGVSVRDVGFLGPALVFALALGTMEEVAYRGALLHWLGRNVGIWVAAGVQALVYGLAYGVGAGESALLVGTVTGAGALVAGAIVIRTRSLLVPIAWHVALAVPLYAWLACRG